MNGQFLHFYQVIIVDCFQVAIIRHFKCRKHCYLKSECSKIISGRGSALDLTGEPSSWTLIRIRSAGYRLMMLVMVVVYSHTVVHLLLTLLFTFSC